MRPKLLDGLKKDFDKLSVLKGIDVDIHKGDVMVVIGPSGSGKSTFLRSLNLMEEPTDGEIIFHNIDITKDKFVNKHGKVEKVDINLHRQKMGMVFQHFNLFPHMTLLQNLTLGPIKLLKKTKAEADDYSRNTRSHADEYSQKTRTDADDYSQKTKAEADDYRRDAQKVVKELVASHEWLMKGLQ